MKPLKKSPKHLKRRIPYVIKNTAACDKPNNDIVDIINIYKPEKKSAYESTIENKIKI